MQIRTRLTVRFSLIVTIILVVFSNSIFFISSKDREDRFFSVIKSRALSEGKLFSKDVKEVDTNLLRILDKSRISPFSSVILLAIYDDTGKEVYRFPNELAAPILSKDTIIKILANKELRFQQNKIQTAWEYYAGKTDHYFIYVSGFDQTGYDKLYFLAWVIFFCCTVSILVTFITAYFYPIHLLAPINYIIDLVEEITDSNLDLRLPVGKSKDEIDRLATKFNDMLQRLEESFEMKRDFISNASHELRTPLGVMMVQIEVAMMSERTPEEYKKTLGSLLEDIKNLRVMMNGLLELTEANMQPGSLKLKSIRIDEMLWLAKSDLQNQHPDYKVIENYSNIPEDSSKLVIQGNDLLRTSFVNIMNNSCKYSEDKTVIVNLESKNNEIIISFSDKGIGIPPAEMKNIIRPFYRGSNAKSFPGNGLGLALTQKIIELHKGEVRIDSRVNEYTTVTVILPIETK